MVPTRETRARRRRGSTPGGRPRRPPAATRLARVGGPRGPVFLAVAADRRTLVGFERAGAGGTWTASLPFQFAQIAGMTADGGGALSEPVLGANGGSLFYLLTPASVAPGLFESRWDS